MSMALKTIPPMKMKKILLLWFYDIPPTNSDTAIAK